MALSAVSSAITTIGNLLAEEAKYLWGVKDEVERLQMELSWMQCFLSLKDADVRQDEDKRIRMWVAEIRELAYDAEDVVESFALKSKRKRGFFNVVKRSACKLNELWLLHETRSKIEKILARIADLTRRLQTYGIKELTDVNRASASNVRRERRQSYPYIEEDNLVGLTNKIKEIVRLLTKDCQCRVVSICGMGGLGKTTLAKKVFNHDDVRKEFSYFAWVYVSQQFQRKEVWEQVLVSFNKMNEERRKRGDADVAKELSDFLKENKCLVLLDDVWNVEDWNLLSPAFPTKESHSKILLTSRNERVIKAANDGRSCCMYELKGLNEDNSWELFQKIAFRNISPDSTDYSNLEGLGKEMVKRCEGLPLAITLLGGTLRKYSSQEWQKVSEHVESYLKRDNEKKIEDVLALSYEELPSYLRPCFLYLGHFPEDYEIHASKLIQLWIAEGFVSLELDGEEFVENVAESYLVELVERFMVQVGKREAASLKIKTCRMHDLMRDLCLSKAKQENFFHFMDGSSYNKLSLCAARRIVANGCSHVGIKGCNNLRSLLFLNSCGDDPFEDVSCIHRIFKLHGSWEYIFNHFKLVRVLDFEGRNRTVNIELPNDIGNLIHLRFLSIRSLGFPYNSNGLSFLGNLTCLQTLDLRVPCTICVPNVLWKLEQLKHLYLPHSMRKKNYKLALHTLTKLQTFVNFDREFCWVKHLSQLTSLRKLKIIGSFFSVEKDFNKDSDGNPLIIKSKHLMYLSISLTYYQIIESIDVALFLSSCHNICKLSLKGPNRIVKLPEYGNFSSDIVEIILDGCGVKEDPMPTLEKLPNLRILIIKWNAFIGKEMVCSPNGFPNLHSLTLSNIEHLKRWKVDEGAMPALRHLSIQYCPKMKVPDGLRFITTLQVLKIIDMPKQFKDKVEEGLQHLPSLILQYIQHSLDEEEETISINKESDQNEVEIASTADD